MKPAARRELRKAAAAAGMTPANLHVLLAVVDYSDDDDRTFVSQRTIIADLDGMFSGRYVRECWAALVDAGWIVDTGERVKSARQRLAVLEVAVGVATDAVRASRSAALEGRTRRGVPVDNEPTRAAWPARVNGSTRAGHDADARGPRRTTRAGHAAPKHYEAISKGDDAAVACGDPAGDAVAQTATPHGVRCFCPECMAVLEAKAAVPVGDDGELSDAARVRLAATVSNERLRVVLGLEAPAEVLELSTPDPLEVRRVERAQAKTRPRSRRMADSPRGRMAR